MKPTDADIATAVGHLSMMKFFPASDVTQQAIMQLLKRMVGTREQLNWLTQTLINHVTEWPGAAEIRGLFCTKYRPSDGIDGNCTLPGWTQLDFESRVIAEHELRKLGWVDDKEKLHALIAGVERSIV